MKNDFLTDIKTLRQRARQHIEKGAVTQSYQGDLETAVRVNEALATEIVCVLRYRRHYFMPMAFTHIPRQRGFLEHAKEDRSMRTR